MKLSQKREFLENAVTGALPPIAVVVYELLLKQFAEGRRWILLVSLLGFYLIALGLIFAIDGLLDLVQNAMPISIPSVGAVDGWWVNVVRGLGGQPLGGATIHIQSSGDRFVIRGEIYSLQQEGLSKMGYFDGTGYVMGNDTLAYYYKGFVNDDLDVGSGHFTFEPPVHPEKTSQSYRGSFIGIRKFGNANDSQPAHRTVGHRVPENPNTRTTPGDSAHQFLLQGLYEESGKVGPHVPVRPKTAAPARG